MEIDILRLQKGSPITIIFLSEDQLHYNGLYRRAMYHKGKWLKIPTMSVLPFVFYDTLDTKIILFSVYLSQMVLKLSISIWQKSHILYHQIFYHLKW